MTSELESLRAEMASIGLTPNQRETFEADVPKARAAIAKALAADAFNPAAYSVKAFRTLVTEISARPLPKANRHGVIDPTHTDDGERIWQWYEVDDVWRRGYLADCWKALRDEREPAARYQPSPQEYDDLKAIIGELEHEPATLRMTAEKALQAWGMLWFGEPEMEQVA